MELIGSQGTKIARRMFGNRRAKLLRRPGRFKPRKRQMRRERPPFARSAKFFRSLFDSRRQNLQIRRSLDARPENARMLFVGEKTHPAKIKCYWLIGAHTGQCALNAGEVFLRYFADEFQRHLKIFRTHPASLW